MAVSPQPRLHAIFRMIIRPIGQSGQARRRVRCPSRMVPLRGDAIVAVFLATVSARAGQSAMSIVAGGFLGGILAGDGAASEAPDDPEVTDGAEEAPSVLLTGEPFSAALCGADSAGRRRGSGGDFRSTCGIGIGGTNLSSICATGIARVAKKPGKGGRTGGIARAGLSAAADASRQKQKRMAGNVLTPTISAPARNKTAACVPTILTIYGAI
jgi:hypothetical protein